MKGHAVEGVGSRAQHQRELPGARRRRRIPIFEIMDGVETVVAQQFHAQRAKSGTQANAHLRLALFHRAQAQLSQLQPAEGLRIRLQR